ncbi:MAG: multiheme c-type cytochrome [Myxococcales bacterium]
MDPASCQSCHPQQFSDWSGSMHAYAAEDPVFLAMHERAQQESNGALGDFCVKCHAPLAVAQGALADPLAVAKLPGSLKGVTCYFCHATSSIEGTHNNPLHLAADGTLFGPFGDPVASTPHKSSYSALFDLARPESAAACGTCHDIVNGHGAAVERTYSEWQSTLFVDPKLGQTCVRCHMNQSEGPASTTSTGKIRSLGSHALPGVDVALTPFPQADAQKQLVQNLLDTTLSGTLCLTDDLKIEITVDNVAAGHFVPSGATPDRRLWAEVIAYQGDQVLYQSGVVPADGSVDSINDPDLWLIRDCLTDENDQPVHMFWDAAKVTANAIPGPVKQVFTDPSTYTRSHVRYVYPGMGSLPAKPDRITMRVLLKPIGDDILNDLVASGNLDPALARSVPQFEFSAAKLEWTGATGKAPTDTQTRTKVPGLSCVSNGTQYFNLPTRAVSHARCP